ncbi:MAG: hypothetical protein COS65_14285 [Armatimonadetes bacterium CG06_land_8_20_14_3_00_66_21]|nr:MAG: hypothetical protein COS65_14285 [Armatimonadetes bacterium CG06_land_8_20_14_3_00_66_21]
MSGNPEFVNQVALAKWRAATSTALFALLPNLRQTPALTWQVADGQNLVIQGPGWTDRVAVTGNELSISRGDQNADVRLPL